MTLKDEYILDLPEAPDFISEEPKMEYAELIALCESMLPIWNAIRYSKPDPEIIADAFVLD
ncbi:MAG: hypothetical protein KBC84_08485 [Proteobacteria bacterium]|nr:hypothetical protein [Pseudomonadota bacterium]